MEDFGASLAGDPNAIASSTRSGLIGLPSVSLSGLDGRTMLRDNTAQETT